MNCSSCDVHARGHIILTLIPSLAHSVAATLVRPLIPSLAAGHFGDAELEIGRVCVQLASPDFKYMTGETLTLEGGLGQRP